MYWQREQKFFKKIKQVGNMLYAPQRLHILIKLNVSPAIKLHILNLIWTPINVSQLQITLNSIQIFIIIYQFHKSQERLCLIPPIYLEIHHQMTQQYRIALLKNPSGMVKPVFCALSHSPYLMLALAHVLLVVPKTIIVLLKRSAFLDQLFIFPRKKIIYWLLLVSQLKTIRKK